MKKLLFFAMIALAAVSCTRDNPDPLKTDDSYTKWLGNWRVPRGITEYSDTWKVEPDVPNESFKVSGISGFSKTDKANGAFVAIVEFDKKTKEMVFKVYENSDVTWNDSSRGTMTPFLSGRYTNVEGKTYYNSNIGVVICRAKLSKDGKSASLTPSTVTSAGAPASFFRILWFGRYTNSEGSIKAVSWTDCETELPATMTKAE